MDNYRLIINIESDQKEKHLLFQCVERYVYDIVEKLQPKRIYMLNEVDDKEDICLFAIVDKSKDKLDMIGSALSENSLFDGHRVELIVGSQKEYETQIELMGDGRKPMLLYGRW